LCQKFNELIESFGFVNRVQQPTHDRGGSLDVVLTRSDLPSPATIIIDIKDVGISDHSLIKWTTNLNGPPPILESMNRRNWRNFQVNKFRSAVQASLFCDAAHLDSPNDQLGVVYNDFLTNTVDQMNLLRSVTIRRRPSDPWFDDVCREEKRQSSTSTS
jgi:hypothetical protein